MCINFPFHFYLPPAPPRFFLSFRNSFDEHLAIANPQSVYGFMQMKPISQGERTHTYTVWQQKGANGRTFECLTLNWVFIRHIRQWYRHIVYFPKINVWKCSLAACANREYSIYSIIMGRMEKKNRGTLHIAVLCDLISFSIATHDSLWKLLP